MHLDISVPLTCTFVTFRISMDVLVPTTPPVFRIASSISLVPQSSNVSHHVCYSLVGNIEAHFYHAIGLTVKLIIIIYPDSGLCPLVAH